MFFAMFCLVKRAFFENGPRIAKKYYFNPLVLLRILGNIYINLGYDKKIIEAISNERLYKEESYK